MRGSLQLILTRSSTLGVAALLVAAAGLGACVREISRNGRGGGDDGSILTSIEGLDKEDRARPNLKYTLVCDVGGKIQGDISGEGEGESILFKAAQVTASDNCALEVRADFNPQLYTWRGIKADGTPDEGLFYGSSKANVGTTRHLTLTLYKLYIPEVKDPFNIKIRVKFNLGAGVNAVPMPTDAALTGANIICSDARNYGGKFAKTGDKDATLSFKLSISEMKGQSCTAVAIIDLKQKVDIFKGAVTNISFPDPKASPDLEFPASTDEPFVVEQVIVPGTGVNVSTASGDCFLGYNVDSQACLDRTVVALPRAKNFVIAKVKGHSKSGADVTYFVGAGEGTFGLYDGSELTVAAINKSLAADATDSEKKMFSFWSTEIEATLFTPEFDKDFVSGKLHLPSLIVRDSLASGNVKVLHLDSVWVHGFNEVPEASLNKERFARWLALVTAKKLGSADAEFFVSGYVKYFSSTLAPAGTREAPVYLDMTAVLAEMAAASAPSKWRLYAIKGGAMAESTCVNEKTYYLDELSQHTNEAVNSNGTEDATIDACEVVKGKVGPALSGYTFEAKFYLWNWKSL